ncbi:MAG: MFS transporter, partial [bacterium]
GLATLWFHVLTGRVLAWFGRGGRAPVRDAILVDSIAPEHYGKSLGFERTLDTVGAIIGPALAFGLIGLYHYRTVFFLTVIPGLIAAGIFTFAVHSRPIQKSSTAPKVSFRALPSQFRWFLVAVAIFGIGDFAHTLLILRATQILAPEMGSTAAKWAIALYLVHNVIYAGLSTPVGAFGDRFGKVKILSLGYFVAVLMNLGFLFQPTHVLGLAILFGLGGVFIAVEDALERAVAADLLPEHVRATGFGTLAAVNGVGDLISSAVVGLLWTKISPAVGFGYAAVLSLAGAIFLFGLNRKMSTTT